MSVSEWNPLDTDLFAQEMEVEALDAIHDAQFAVVGTCKACLDHCEINTHHLCESCEETNQRTEGGLSALLN